MKTLTRAMFLVALLLSGVVFAQEQASSPKSENASAAFSKPLTVAGQVSNDRKTLVTDIDSEWSVSNPDALKGHEGRRVTLKCYVDTARNKLQVLSVKKDASETTYSAVDRFDRR